MSGILTSIKRTPYQSLSTFSILFFTLFLSLTILFSLTFLYGLLGYIESRPQVTVYFKPETNEADIFKMRDDLIASGKVSSAKYVSKNEAFTIYKNLNKDNPLLLEMVSADILPPSLEIYAVQPAYLPQIAEMLKNKPGVDEVNFQKVIIERLINLTNIIRKSTLIFFIFLTFNAIITLLTIGHFKIALKKDEIELLRYLGASQWYVKKPFVQEAIAFALTSTTIIYLIFLGIVFYLQPFINSYMRGVNNLGINFQIFQLTVWPLNITYLASLFVITALFGVVISTAATLFATQKYIK